MQIINQSISQQEKNAPNTPAWLTLLVGLPKCTPRDELHYRHPTKGRGCRERTKSGVCLLRPWHGETAPGGAWRHWCLGRKRVIDQAMHFLCILESSLSSHSCILRRMAALKHSVFLLAMLQTISKPSHVTCFILMPFARGTVDVLYLCTPSNRQQESL